jgi:hypothetical protein
MSDQIRLDIAPASRRFTLRFRRPRRDLPQTPAGNIVGAWLEANDPFPRFPSTIPHTPCTPSTALVPFPVNRVLRFEDLPQPPQMSEDLDVVQQVPAAVEARRTLVAHSDREMVSPTNRSIYKSTGTIAGILELPQTTPQRPRPRPCVIDTPTRQRAVQLATSSSEYRRLPFAALKMELGIQCSDSTFIRATHKKGCFRLVRVVAPFVNARNKEKRHPYALLLEYHTANLFFNFI